MLVHSGAYVCSQLACCNLAGRAGAGRGVASSEGVSWKVIAKRQSARCAQLRKAQYIVDLEAHVSRLRDQLSQLQPQLAHIHAQHTGREGT